MSEKQHIERFLHALSLAIYDKLLETAGHQIVFFYDADVIIKLVLGFEHEYADARRSRGQLRRNRGETNLRIVRALLSTGYLGPFYLVRTHAFELYEQIRKHPQYLDESSRRSFREKALQYIESVGIKDDMERLLDIVRNHDAQNGSSRDIAEEFLKILQEKSAENFAFIEQVNGTWDQRLRRYYDKKLLRLDLLGPEISDLFLDFRESLDGMHEIIRNKRPSLPLNAFQDAAALTILHQFVVNSEKGEKRFMARFYTETLDLKEVLEKDEKLASYLTYTEISAADQLFSPPKEAHHIYRDSDYFIMRALFEELSPLTPVGGPGSLGKLIRLAKEIKYLLETGESEVEKRLLLLNESFDDMSLVDRLQSFEKLSILRPLWVKGPVPDILKESDSLVHWLGVFRFAKENRTEELLHAQISDIREELETHVAKTRVWANDFKMILKAREDRLNNLGSLEDPMRDLGLVRWGYDLTLSEQEKVIETIGSLANADETDLTIHASLLATDMQQARQNPTLCRVVVAILWALGRFDEIVEVVDASRLESDSLEFPPTLVVIRAAARMRSGKIVSPEERRSITEEISDLLDAVSPEQWKAVLLGVGYILYQAWRQEMIRFPPSERLPDRQSDEIKELARKSIQIGEEAYETLEPNTLAWAYAVNHYAYVATVTGLEPAKATQYLATLLGLKTFPALWNSRFDDTVGAYYLCHIERSWWSSTREEKVSLDFTNDLANAREYLQAAKRKDPGDIDIQEHLGRLDIIAKEIDDFRKNLKHT